jgi:group II intron reverse transcriptase/maturase
MGRVWNVEQLYESFRTQSGKKAPGIDGVRKEDYAEGVDEKLLHLSDELKKMAYRPPPVRRVYIPKLNGGQRPLGIPTFESRIVQDRMAKVLSAIWEPEFRECSYGYRSGRSQHQALRAVHEVITTERTEYVVEADIKGFFNHVSHDHLMRFLEHRIADQRFLRLIRRFLKAGVMEDGAFSEGNEGTPQGGLISPVLSNIYLHYVLDLWFEKRFAKTCRGIARLVRYADDYVAFFQHREDAERYYKEMQERLAEFSLEVEPTKTLLIPCGLKQSSDEKKQGTFTFLGFTHYVTKSRRGFPKLGRKTSAKKMRTKLKEVSAKLKALRTKGTNVMVSFVRLHLQGHINYYGVSENSRSLSTYCYRVRTLLFKWLNRRSSKRSCTWDTFTGWLARLSLPTPRIVHSFYT